MNFPPLEKTSRHTVKLIPVATASSVLLQSLARTMPRQAREELHFCELAPHQRVLTASRWVE